MTATPLAVVVQHRFQPPSPGWLDHLGEQVRYLGHEGTPLFARSMPTVGPAQARARLEASCGQHVAFHRLILSVAPQSGVRSQGDVEHWTVALLEDLEQRLQRDLVYVAAAHTGEGVLHSHVLVAGRAFLQGTLRRAEVHLHLEDCAYLRVRGTELAHTVATSRAARAARLARYLRRTTP